ncbi:hypothetical protein PsorP6_004497 [Peronosclerospora sorghi]|uniref:Uncharacterized protein n=1 Tax=Peronosclerospora sorghi TaxID=230839 RepID=A0ACC0VPK7_9STRA|nr:hypothetical protein PsorP6_004497 [Peronosclerospora sorghi]
MGFAHSLEVLCALLRLYTVGLSDSSSWCFFSDLPYPYLQQRLQQTLRATALTAFGAVCIPLVLLCLLPVLFPFKVPSFPVFILVAGFLWTVTIAQVTLRYALLPTTRRVKAELDVNTRGGLQAAVCTLIDIVMSVREQPQLPLLLLLYVVHSYVWKLVMYFGMAYTAYVSKNIGSFAVSGGFVSFISLTMVEKSLGEDPFVLDPRLAFVKAMQRDVVRAARRGVLAYVLGCALSRMYPSSNALGMKMNEVSFLSLQVSTMAFQITSGVLENFTILSAASVFRILLFRANYRVVNGKTNGAISLWNLLAVAKTTEGDVFSVLFETEIAPVPLSSTPLNEQYLQGLHKRMEEASKNIADKKMPKISADAEDVVILDSLFKFENLLTGCKFNANARESLFASLNKWNALVSSTTAVIDGFTLMLHVLNSLQDKKSSSSTGADADLALEQSFSSLLGLLKCHQDVHPLVLLLQYPHLANLTISSASAKSPIKFFVESKLQFAVRRFLMKEARRRVFQRTKVVRAAESLLCHLVSASRAEDKQGYVQHTIPAVLVSLTNCRNALETYMESCLKGSGTTDVYVQEASALATGAIFLGYLGIDSGIYRIAHVFQSDLAMSTFPHSVKTTLDAYISYDP